MDQEVHKEEQDLMVPKDIKDLKVTKVTKVVRG
jgi:hypothetical protein